MNNNCYMFVIYGLANGGAERVISVLSSNLAEKGKEVHLCIYKKTDGDYPLSDKVNLHIMKPSNGTSMIKNMLFRIKQTKECIDKIKPDFVIPFMGTVITETFIASRGKKTKCIPALRVDPQRMELSKINHMLIMYAFNHSEAVFTQNETQKKFFKKKTQEKTFCLFNPVSEAFIENEHKEVTDIKNIITSGRLTNQKNHKMLIDAIEIVSKKHSDVKLTIYGQGELQEELSDYIKSKKLTNNVLLAGRTNDMLDRLLENDLFVLPSDFEGMPNALLEAMALSMPCISTDCRTGPSDMITPYENGILTPINDAEKMAEAICYMIENPSKANEMAKKAREFAMNNCTTEIVVNKFITECEKIK